MKFYRDRAFRSGVVDLLGVTPGLAAWGVMTGVAIAKSGMSLVAILSMSTIVFAGSSQLAALPLIASGAPAWVVMAAAFCVNLRFVVFSMHLRPYVMHLPLWRRLVGGYLLADLGYVMVLRRYPIPPTDPSQTASLDAYWLGLGVMSWSTWTGSTLVGVALGDRVPVGWGMGFAGILALLGVAASLVSTRLRVVSAVVASGAAIVALALPFKLGILVAIVTAVAVCLLLEKIAAPRGRVTARP